MFVESYNSNRTNVITSTPIVLFEINKNKAIKKVFDKGGGENIVEKKRKCKVVYILIQKKS